MDERDNYADPDSAQSPWWPKAVAVRVVATLLVVAAFIGLAVLAAAIPGFRLD